MMSINTQLGAATAANAYHPQIRKEARLAMEKLVACLEEKPKCNQRDQLIEDAKNYRFCGALSSHLMGSTLLIKNLENAGYTDLVARALEGEFED